MIRIAVLRFILIAAIGLGGCIQFPSAVYGQSAASADASSKGGSQTSSIAVTKVEIGVGGNYRLGCWTQARLEIDSPAAVPSARVELTLPDGEGVPCTFVVQDVAIPVGVSSLAVNVKVGRVDSDLTVQIYTAQASVDPEPSSGVSNLLLEHYVAADELSDAVLASKFLVLTLGGELGVEDALRGRQQKETQRPVQAEVTDASVLPNYWLGYGGVNLVIMPTSAESVVAKMTDQQLGALEEWVRMGGRVIVSAGADAASTIAQREKLSALVPGVFDRVRLQRETSGFESYAGKTAVSLRQFSRPEDMSFRVPMAVLKDLRGKKVLSEGLGEEETPAVVRASHGFGQVVFFAADLDLAPIAKWTEGRRKILSRLVELSLGETGRSDQKNQFSSLTRIGFDDITGQLRSSLDQFASSKLVPFSWIAFLIGAYILLIGPIDYFLLKRWKERFSLTWITFPLMVLAASALAYGLTQSWKSSQLAINQINLVDVDAATGSLRGTSWGHVLSPANNKYDFQVSTSKELFPKLQRQGELSAWQGLPGDGFGGMNVRRQGSTNSAYDVVLDKDDEAVSMQVRSLPIDIHSTRSLSGLTWGTTELPKVESLTADFENQLSGIVRNPLPVPLKNCQLYFDRWLYPLPSLAPDADYPLETYTVPKTIKFILTNSRVNEDTKKISTRWDRLSFDARGIMQMMMFHKSVGGSTYTSLLHRFQPEIDMTDHLSQDRAVLVGTVDKSAINWLDADTLATAELNAQSFVRIILPVKRKSRSDRRSRSASN